MTFDRNPLSLLRPEVCPPAVVSNLQKTELLEDGLVDAVLVIEFTQSFSELSPADFAVHVLVEKLRARVVFAGRDFRFGARGEGDLDILRALGAEHGFQVVMHDDVTELDDATGLADATGPDDADATHAVPTRRISSTWVRELLTEGRVREATALLGREHRIRSRVVHGEQRGRELGYPTANLAPEIEGMLPVDAVYACWAYIDGKRYGAAVSIGNNPTFDGIPQHQVEAHLLDEKLDLYGHTIELAFVEHIRPMRKFDGVEPLMVQLRADEARIREVLAAEPVA